MNINTLVSLSSPHKLALKHIFFLLVILVFLCSASPQNNKQIKAPVFISSWLKPKVDGSFWLIRRWEHKAAASLIFHGPVELCCVAIARLLGSLLWRIMRRVPEENGWNRWSRGRKPGNSVKPTHTPSSSCGYIERICQIKIQISHHTDLCTPITSRKHGTLCGAAGGAERPPAFRDADCNN